MNRALSLARLALGHTSPNPAVGAVVVRDGAVVGEGFTQPPGSAHAEVVALEKAGEQARGAALYVTLEPCCHFGRTPPCTRALIQAGVAEVHLATLDPNPLVSGRGREELERAGIRTRLGEGEEEAREINEAYLKHITTGTPFVTAKFAMSLDGKIATRTGDSRWITGEESRRLGHDIRCTVDAIMVGVNTVLADDPQLTPRPGGGEGTPKNPLRVVVDSHARTPPTARLFRVPGPTLVVTTQAAAQERARALSKAGAEVLTLPSHEGMVDVRELLHALGQREITSVLVEGGGILLGSLFDLGLVDKVLAFIAPVVIGGQGAPTAVGGAGVERVAQAPRLSRVRIQRCQDDILVIGYAAGEPVPNQVAGRQGLP